MGHAHRRLPSSDVTNDRIEILIMQQNALLQRQLELTEKQHRQTKYVPLQSQRPSDIFKVVNPCVREVFKRWRRQLRSRMKVYVAQSRVCKKYQMKAADAKLISPFQDEARKPWAWSQFYRSVAQPIHGKDPVMPDNVQVGNAGGDDNADAEPCERVSSNYDVDAALASLRRG